MSLNKDDERYEKYLAHKMSDGKNAIENDRLLGELRARRTNSESIFGDLVRRFECDVCEKLHGSRGLSRMTTKQFNCSLPKTMIPIKKPPNSWMFQFLIDKCSAKLLVDHVLSGTKINIDNFTRKAFEMYENNDCES